MDALSFFTDPVLRAPTIGSMFMCLAAALVGVVVFLRKQSLIGESLSHAAYPGVMLGVISAALLFPGNPDGGGVSLLVLIGAGITALIGLWLINWLERKMRVRSDSALCLVLSVFFGIGLTLASDIQFTYTTFYKQALSYLYGQTATMTDIHILIYGLLSLIVIGMVVFLFKELQVITFDRNYAKSLGINVRSIDSLVFILVVLAVIVGIRSVGVVLMSAMLIAPAAAARQYTNKLSVLLFLAGIFGLASGFFGNYFSVIISQTWSGIPLPTGPMIVMVATVICVFSLLFAPERGLLLRLVRIARFRHQCLCENLLKALWRAGPDKPLTFDEIASFQTIGRLQLHVILWKLVFNGWVTRLTEGTYRLTRDGEQRASQIVRLHRLWEVYLADYLGVGAERVHKNAEEMEHILTPELEEALTILLKNPKHDPHQQPIPPRDRL